MRLGPTLTSVHNPTVKYARSLHQKRARYRERVLLVEGVRLFSDCVSAGAAPRAVFVEESRNDELAQQLAPLIGDAPVYPVSSRVLASMTETESPQGLVAILPFPELALPALLDHPGLFLIPDAVQDPGNLGTLIRAAVGAGADAVFVPPDTVDPFAPKVMRAGMSAQYRIPIQPFDWSGLPVQVAACRQLLAAEAESASTYDSVDWTAPSCLVVGNEARGLTPGAKELMSGSVSIPLAGKLESLNVAVAASVILFEAARQRRAAGFTPA